MKLPEEFKARMKELVCDSYDSFISALENESAVRALRVNTRKISKDSFLQCSHLELEPLPFCDNGFVFQKEKIGADPLHHAGAYYVQDPGAMCTFAAAKDIIKKGMCAIDLCAAPGGKASQLIEYTEDGGFLVANEIDKKRCRILRGNLERMGSRRCVLTNTDTKALAEHFGSVFDLVVCDAPCSGEGMMRKYESAVSEWSVENVLMCAERQAEILDNAATLTAPAGYLLYSTCTFSLEENEMTVDAFLSRHRDFTTVPVSKSVEEITAPGIDFSGAVHSLSHCRRFYPHLFSGEGQFFCIMKKSEDSPRILPRKKKKKQAPKKALSPEELKIVKKFFGDNLSLELSDDSFDTLGEHIMLNADLPEAPECVLSGTCAGYTEKGRFVPHHHLFSAMGEHFKRRVMLSSHSAEAIAYLSGEVIDTDIEENGWCCVFIDSCPVGGGKIVDKKVKNHYPKGLRLLNR